MRPLRVIRDSFADDPLLDTAISRALLDQVRAGELPETLRLARPGPMVSFGRRDAVSPGYPEAVAAARARGYEAVLGLAGGRAAVFHEHTIAFAHTIPDPDPRPGVDRRFELVSELMGAALRGLGVDARVGEVPGEYCPGRYSVNARGQTKLMGVGQRVVSGAAHVGGVVVVDAAPRVRETLRSIYAAIGLDWAPASVGSVADEVPGTGFDEVVEAILSEYSGRYHLVEAGLDPKTLDLAHRLAPEHRCPDRSAVASPSG